jgi:hypothetical protein
MTVMQLPDNQDVSALITYDPQAGHFYRKKNGKRADTEMTIGYRRVRLKVGDKVHEFLAHRLAWLMTNGDWPKDEIDHINGDRCDNSIQNLRHVSRLENARNIKLRIDNSSGLSGLDLLPSGSWRVRIGANHVGCYQTKSEAIAARSKFLCDNGYTQRHGS